MPNAIGHSGVPRTTDEARGTTDASIVRPLSSIVPAQDRKVDLNEVTRSVLRSTTKDEIVNRQAPLEVDNPRQVNEFGKELLTGQAR